MNDTKTRILDAAQELIQTGGFCAMSFQDIAEIVNIKKPSIVHHFASKFKLGKAVIERYHSHFKEAMEEIEKDPSKTKWDALEFYFTPYLDFGEAGDKVCLCGALAGEFMSLDDSMQEEVKGFFLWHEKWLTELLRSGKSLQVFTFDEAPEYLAKMFLSALQGALLIKRTTNDPAQLYDVIKVIKSRLVK